MGLSSTKSSEYCRTLFYSCIKHLRGGLKLIQITENLTALVTGFFEIGGSINRWIYKVLFCLGRGGIHNILQKKQLYGMLLFILKENCIRFHICYLSQSIFRIKISVQSDMI